MEEEKGKGKGKLKVKNTPPQSRKQSRITSTSETDEMWSVQCGKCFKWRLVPTQEEYEEIRRNFTEEPFVCSKKPGASCEDPPDIEYNNNHTWVIDKPNLPKTPLGFKRRMIMRKDYSRMDCYYTAPDGKKLRAVGETLKFVEKYPEYNLSIKDFSFTCPKVMDDTLPSSKFTDDTLSENEVN